MSYNGKKKNRNKFGNKPEKNTLSYHSEKVEINEELEYNQLVISINEYYDDLIQSIQGERELIIRELEGIFQVKSAAEKDIMEYKRIARNQNLYKPPPEYFFKKVSSTTANSKSHAYLLKNIFLGDESIGRKSFVDGVNLNFLRVEKFNSKFYYLTSDPNDVLYVSNCVDLSTAKPLSDWQRQQIQAERKEKSKKGSHRFQEDINEFSDNLEQVQNDWAAESNEMSWDTPAETTSIDSWGTDNIIWETWGVETDSISSDEVGIPFDFVITGTSDVFITYPTSGRVGHLRLYNLNSNKVTYCSIPSISQPTGICLLQSSGCTLVVIIDRSWSKLTAFNMDVLKSNQYQGSSELNSEFTIQFGKNESPLLVYGSNVERQFLILSRSNAIFIANDTGGVIHKLPYAELVSPYDMRIMADGNILVVDLESLVVLDRNGRCISKYFHDVFSQLGCIHYPEECIEFITRSRENRSQGLESIEVAILD